jgi:hypothetical protein
MVAAASSGLFAVNSAEIGVDKKLESEGQEVFPLVE